MNTPELSGSLPAYSLGEYFGAPVICFPGLSRDELVRLGAAANSVLKVTYGNDAQVLPLSSLMGRLDVPFEAKRPVDALCVEVPESVASALDPEAVAVALQNMHISVAYLDAQLPH